MTMFRLPNGKIVEKDDLYDYVPDIYTEDDYREYLNNSDFHEMVEDASADNIRVLSPTDFRLAYVEEIDFMYQDREYGSLEGIGFKKVGRKWKTPDGKTYSDEDVYNVISDFYTEDDYEDYLSEMKMSDFNFTLPLPGDFLYKTDYVAFRSGYNDEIDYMVSEAEYGSLEPLGVEIVEDSDNRKSQAKKNSPRKKAPARKPPVKKGSAKPKVKSKTAAKKGSAKKTPVKKAPAKFKGAKR